jgi:hypothetical protein
MTTGTIPAFHIRVRSHLGRKSLEDGIRVVLDGEFDPLVHLEKD